MLKPETVSCSVKYFRNDQAIYMFDPETFKVYVRDGGGWLESDDPGLREDIRFRSIELSRAEVLKRAS
ncbi:MAG: hypothetical protein ACM3KE_17495 [Hyphomicrobiales bacterium]